MNCNEYIAYIQKEIEEKEQYEDYKYAFEAYKVYLEKRLKENQKDVEAACQLGAVLLELRKSEEECLQPLEALLMTFEEQLDDWQKARLHIDIAGICEYGPKCRLHLEKAVTLNLPIPNGYDALGRLYMGEDNYAKAETLFAKAVQLSKEPIYRYNYAVSLYQNQKFQEAKEVFETLHLEQPDDRLVIYGYAVCCYLLGEKEQGATLVEKLEQTLEGAENVLEEEIDTLHFLGKEHRMMGAKKHSDMQIRLYCKDECYLLECPRHQKI